VKTMSDTTRGFVRAKNWRARDSARARAVKGRYTGKNVILPRADFTAFAKCVFGRYPMLDARRSRVRSFASALMSGCNGHAST
jgi:hypothetical protein